MDPALFERARAGLQAWQEGSLTALEALLDPDVELNWWEPGEWDCHGRDEVLRLLRARQEEGVSDGKVELIDAGDDTLISVSRRHPDREPDWPEEAATVIYIPRRSCCADAAVPLSRGGTERGEFEDLMAHRSRMHAVRGGTRHVADTGEARIGRAGHDAVWAPRRSWCATQ